MPKILIVNEQLGILDKDITRIEGIDDLRTLRRIIDGYLHQQGIDHNDKPYISSIEARQIIAARGYQMPSATLINAYARGNIVGAKKIPGSNRWESTEEAFLTWLDRWAARTHRKTSTTPQAAPADSNNSDGAL